MSSYVKFLSLVLVCAVITSGCAVKKKKTTRTDMVVTQQADPDITGKQRELASLQARIDRLKGHLNKELAKVTSSGSLTPAATRSACEGTEDVPAALLRPEVIRKLQRNLQKEGHNPGPADGVFGDQTYSALVNYQLQHGLSASGVTMESLRYLGVI